MNQRIASLFYRHYEIRTEIDGIRYMIEYSRSPFWTYEKPTWRLFLKEKLCLWHGQVWEEFPGGGRCGFGTCCLRALFPKKKMKQFLLAESRRVHKICHEDSRYAGNGA